MLIFVLDDEALLLQTEAQVIRDVRPEAELRCFQRAQEALEAIQNEGWNSPCGCGRSAPPPG